MLGRMILVLALTSAAPCIGSEPTADDGYLQITAHIDVVAAGQCLKADRPYMLRLSESTVVCMKYPLAHPEYESKYPIQTCSAVIQAAVEHMERIRKANH